MLTKLATLIERLRHASMIVRLSAAFILGATATLSMPPWTFWPVLWVVLPLFIVLLDTASSWRRALALGWSFGFGYFATGFGWMTNAFLVDRETFAALAVPAVGALAAGFGLYMAVVAIVFRLLPNAPDTAMPRPLTLYTLWRIVLFAAVWGLVEWWRGWFLTGLPWNPVGSTWVSFPAALQGASIFGVFGLSLITVLAAGSGVLLHRSLDRPLAVKLFVACHLPLVIVVTAGVLRTSTTPVSFVSDVVVRLIQPNIAQADKWRPALREQHLRDQVALSVENAEAVTHVLWAEAAAPFALNQAPQAVTVASTAAPENGHLITGAPRVEGRGVGRRAYNSLYAISPQASIDAIYDKTHLVPFGEYMPLQDLIPIPNIAGGSGWTKGDGLKTLSLPGLPPFSPLICYEVIFPGAVAEAINRPQWLFNLTNDAWFGLSSGPYQHLGAAQLRAVEEGLPVVRVANTGISAVIDPLGRITSQIPLGQKGYLDSPLPEALPPTLFSRVGHALFLALTLGLGGTAVVLGKKAQDKF